MCSANRRKVVTYTRPQSSAIAILVAAASMSVMLASEPPYYTREQIRAGADVSVTAKIEANALVVTWGVRNVSDRLLIVPTRYFTRAKEPVQAACTTVQDGELTLRIHQTAFEEWSDDYLESGPFAFLGRIGVLPGERVEGSVSLSLPLDEVRCHRDQAPSSTKSQAIKQLRLWLELALWPGEWAGGVRLDRDTVFHPGKEFLMIAPRVHHTALIPFEIPLLGLRWDAPKKSVVMSLPRDPPKR